MQATQILKHHPSNDGSNNNKYKYNYFLLLLLLLLLLQMLHAAATTTTTTTMYYSTATRRRLPHEQQILHLRQTAGPGWRLQLASPNACATHLISPLTLRQQRASDAMGKIPQKPECKVGDRLVKP